MANCITCIKDGKTGECRDIKDKESRRLIEELQTKLNEIIDNLNALTGTDGGHLATDSDIQTLQNQITAIQTVLTTLDNTYATDEDMQGVIDRLDELKGQTIIFTKEEYTPFAYAVDLNTKIPFHTLRAIPKLNDFVAVMGKNSFIIGFVRFISEEEQYCYLRDVISHDYSNIYTRLSTLEGEIEGINNTIEGNQNTQHTINNQIQNDLMGKVDFSDLSTLRTYELDNNTLVVSDDGKIGDSYGKYDNNMTFGAGTVDHILTGEVISLPTAVTGTTLVKILTEYNKLVDRVKTLESSGGSNSGSGASLKTITFSSASDMYTWLQSNFHKVQYLVYNNGKYKSYSVNKTTFTFNDDGTVSKNTETVNNMWIGIGTASGNRHIFYPITFASTNDTFIFSYYYPFNYSNYEIKAIFKIGMSTIVNTELTIIPSTTVETTGTISTYTKASETTESTLIPYMTVYYYE